MHSGSIDTTQERDKVGSGIGVTEHTINNLLAVKDLMANVVRHPGDRLVTDYAGVFSVFTDAYVIDMWGLVNEDIALNGGTNGINPILRQRVRGVLRPAGSRLFSREQSDGAP